MTTTSMQGNARVRRLVLRQSWLLALLLLLIALVINYSLQPNFFRPAILSGNFRTYLPLMFVAAGQAVVIMGGGVDLSVGAIVSLVNVVIVSMLGTQAEPGSVALAIAVGLGAGLLAGAFNGFCVAYLRFQPIVTTFATSFVFSGLALWVMPSPGGVVPQSLMDVVRLDALGVPATLWFAAATLLLWGAVRSTRYIRYLLAVGGQRRSAYVTGVPVSLVLFSTYVIAGLMAALGALAVAMATGTGDPLIGGPLTLNSIVAVVLGGTRLRGGQGGVLGAILGVFILGLIRSIISFANVPTWWQTLVNGLIVVLALAGPGLVALIRRQPE